METNSGRNDVYIDSENAEYVQRLKDAEIALQYNRSGSLQPNGVMFVNFLISKGGTIIWDIHDHTNGRKRKGGGSYHNIYEYCAAEHIAPNEGPAGKIDAAQEHGNSMKLGAIMVKEHQENKYDDGTLYMLHTQKGGNNIDVITIFPNWEDGRGNTARELQVESATKRTKGGCVSFIKTFKRLPNIDSTEDATMYLRKIVEESALDPRLTKPPKRETFPRAE